MFKIFLLLLFFINLYAKEFSIASYNVENLFDLKNDRTEYREYKPFTKSKWNNKNFEIKIKNTIKTIKELNSDIIALQEIENKELLLYLKKRLPQYKYHSFTKYKNSSIGLAFLSKIKILDNKQINVRFSKKLFRPILETSFEVNNIKFTVFNNHWPSKRVKESYRIKYAKKLFDRIKKLPRDYDYILLGDFNSNYNEKQTFKYNKRLNNTDGITAINHVLNTTLNNEYNIKEDILEKEKVAHYNLWLELSSNQRFSNKYRGEKQTPDNIILPRALFDNKKITYVKNSYKVFKPSYLYKNNKINRWQIKNGIHQAYGYSDHLPIYAKFYASKKYQNNKIEKKENLTLISQLYENEKLLEDALIKEAIVIYKNKNNAILKQKNDRAIYFFNNAQDFKLGLTYDLKIQKIISFNGLKEVKKFKIDKTHKSNKNHKEFYLDASKINIHDFKYQNEIIYNLQGIIKNKKLYFQNKKINLYAKDKSLLPKNGSKIEILSGHLSNYKGKVQILIHKNTDYKVID